MTSPGQLADSGTRVEPQADHGHRLPVLISVLALLTVLVFYLGLRLGHRLPSPWIYWGALAASVVPAMLSRNRVGTLFGVGVFIFLQSFAYVLSAPYPYVWATDPIYNSQAAQIIATNHFWVVGVGQGPAYAYSYYPASNLFHVGLSLATGRSLPELYLFAEPLLRFAVLPLAFFKILRTFLGEKASLISLVVFFSTPSYLFNLPVQQEFAYVFVALAVYAALQAPKQAKRSILSGPTSFASMVFLATVAISHYFTAYVSVAILVAFAISSFLRPGRKNLRKKTTRASRKPARPNSSPAGGLQPLYGFRYAAPVFLYIFTLWSLFVSSPVDLFWLDYVQTTVQEAFGPGSFSRPGGRTGGGVRPGYTYTTPELGLMGLAVVLIFLGAFIGAFLAVRVLPRRTPAKGRAAQVLLVFFVTSFVVALFTVPLIFTSGFFLPLRAMEFAGLGITPLVGLTLGYFLARRSIPWTVVAAVGLSIIVVGGSLLQVGNPRSYYIPGNLKYCEVPENLDANVFAAAMWARQHVSHSAKVYGDSLAQDAFGGYGGFDVVSAFGGSYDLFNATVANLSLAYSVGMRFGDLVVTDVHMTKELCFAAVDARPLPAAAVDKFETAPGYQLVFDTETVRVYRWVGGV